MNPSRRPSRRPRGFSLIEILSVVAVLGVLVAVATPIATKAIRRARALSASSELNRVLTQARLNAVKRGFQVVVQLSWDPSRKQIRLQTYEDKNANFAFDAG